MLPYLTVRYVGLAAAVACAYLIIVIIIAHGYNVSMAKGTSHSGVVIVSPAVVGCLPFPVVPFFRPRYAVLLSPANRYPKVNEVRSLAFYGPFTLLAVEAPFGGV